MRFPSAVFLSCAVAMTNKTVHLNLRPFWENIITLIAISIKRVRLQTSFPHDLRGNAASTYLSSKSPVIHRASLPSSTMKICNKAGWIQKVQ